MLASTPKPNVRGGRGSGFAIGSFPEEIESAKVFERPTVRFDAFSASDRLDLLGLALEKNEDL